MAVADLAVQVGPRNRRRLTNAAVGLLVVAAIATAVTFTHPFDNSAPDLSARSIDHTASGPATFFQLVYGLTRQQVQAKVGRPTKTVGQCWEYRLNVEIRGGQTMLNALRLCFEGGAYAYQYAKTDGKWFYPTDRLIIPGR